MVSVRRHQNGVRVDIYFARFPPASHFGLIMPTALGKTTPPGRLRRTKPRSRRTLRRRARQGIREYEFDLVAAAALACSVLASLALAQHAAATLHGHGMGVVRP